jgi:hypothetical protein
VAEKRVGWLRREAVDFRLDARHDHWLLDEFQDTRWLEVAGADYGSMRRRATTKVRSSSVMPSSDYGRRGGE